MSFFHISCPEAPPPVLKKVSRRFRRYADYSQNPPDSRTVLELTYYMYVAGMDYLKCQMMVPLAVGAPSFTEKRHSSDFWRQRSRIRVSPATAPFDREGS